MKTSHNAVCASHENLLHRTGKSKILSNKYILTTLYNARISGLCELGFSALIKNIKRNRL